MHRPAGAADATSRFDDWHAVQTLVMSYSEFVDAGRFAEAAALFKDATYRIEFGPVGHTQVIALRGTSEVHAFMARTLVYSDGTPRTRHTITNLNIQLDGDGATARSYVTALQQTSTLPLQPISTARSLDRFERVDGKWRFADRLIAGILTGDISQHQPRG
jgi:hypothetical protein